MLKKYSQHLKESILDPISKELSCDIWDSENNIKQSVKKEITNILYAWLKKLDVKTKPQAIKICGSMATYQYNSTSDIDINVEIEMSKERAERLRKILPNGSILSGTQHPINYYLVYDSEPDVQIGVYDLLEEKWIKFPDKISRSKKQLDKLYYKTYLDQAISWARKISLDLDEMRRNVVELGIYEHFLETDEYEIDEKDIKKQIEIKKNNIQSGYDTIRMDIHMLKQFRNEAYPTHGNTSSPFTITADPDQKLPNYDFSPNNVIYKILERFGYLDLLFDAKKKYEKQFPEILDV